MMDCTGSIRACITDQLFQQFHLFHSRKLSRRINPSLLRGEDLNHCTIPFVSRMNAVSRFTSSSLSIVSLNPAWISRCGTNV